MSCNCIVCSAHSAWSRDATRRLGRTKSASTPMATEPDRARSSRAWAAIALTTDTSALTAISNDYSYEQVFADPQILARQMVVATDHPTLGAMRTLGSPLKMSATPPSPIRPFV